MYGVPKDLNLTFLHGAQLTQLCLGQFDVQFHFTSNGSISIQGKWELLDAAGLLLDQSQDWPRPPFQLHQLLGCEVMSTEIRSPTWFALRFDTGLVLRIYDDSKHYECCSIQPGNVFI